MFCIWAMGILNCSSNTYVVMETEGVAVVEAKFRRFLLILRSRLTDSNPTSEWKNSLG